ncbi:hypothetical protein D3C72_2189190 [compost metagenome]
MLGPAPEELLADGRVSIHRSLPLRLTCVSAMGGWDALNESYLPRSMESAMG